MKKEEYLKNIADSDLDYYLYVKGHLKPNDYVKLNTGEITRSINVSPIKENKIYYANGNDCWFDVTAVRDFSSNIIDLVQVGDYVNGEKVLSIDTDDCKDYNINNKGWNCFEIKSIVTKEQFESMEYKIGG